MIACFVSGPVFAEGNPFYVGLKGGKMMVSPSEFQDATSTGLVLGFKLSDTASGSLAIEGEFTNSSSETLTVLGTSGTWDIDTTAVYLAYRTGGDAYFKGKMGYLDEKVNASIAGASISGSDSGLSFGIGGGWKIGKSTSLELEYTIIEQDVNFVSVGFNFGF